MCGRSQEGTPDLGEFLVCVGLHESLAAGRAGGAGTAAPSWGSLYLPFLKELFARNVLWLLKAHPDLAEVSESRCKISVESFATGSG